jgi:hypothetical protein
MRFLLPYLLLAGVPLVYFLAGLLAGIANNRGMF